MLRLASLIPIRKLCSYSSGLLAACAVATPLLAVQPSETLLPDTTKGFLSTQDVNEVRDAFNKTQLGEMVADPAMKPFIEDLRRQIGAKMEKAGSKLGVNWEDLEKVYAGEVALAVIQPDPKNKMSHAMALIVDVTGKQKEVDELLAKIHKNQTDKKAVRSVVRSRLVEGMTMTMYTQPLAKGQTVPERSYYFIKDDMLVATDSYNTIDAIAARFGNKEAQGSLAGVKAFDYTMKVAEREKGKLEHHVRWFIEPFGFAEARRAAEGGRKKRGTDMLKILQQQGFTAIQGAGGYIFFNTGDEEILHRTYVYAPAVREKGDKYDLAARMLQFPNGGNLTPQRWALSDVGAYLTMNWKTQDAFKYSETLVDAVAGEPGVFKDMWQSLRTDPMGPRIDIYGGLVNHLGERVTLLSDTVLPVDTKSERTLTAVEVAQPKIVADTIERAFKDDPSAKKIVHGGHVIWEIHNDEESANVSELSIEGAGFVSADSASDEDEDGDGKPLVSNFAVTVFDGHLMFSTHTSFIQDVIDRADAGTDVGMTRDFQRVEKALQRLGSNQDCVRYFARTDESYLMTYELLKQNKLPQGESIFAKLINGVMSEEGVKDPSTRTPEIDGRKLPDFDLVKKYFGPTGTYVQSENDGWYVVGCLLKRETPDAAGVARDKAEIDQAAAPKDQRR